jgi:hypothetical protein
MKKDRSVFIGVEKRRYGLVGAYHFAHTAADTAIFHGGFLADTGEITVFILPLFPENIKIRDPLSPVCQIDSVLRTDGSTVATKCTPVLTVGDDPGEVAIGYAAWCNGYGSS